MDTGRTDAAPRSRGGDGSGGELSTFTFRSENNFGTSSSVPGDPRAKGGGGDAGSDQVADAGLVLTSAEGDTGDPSVPLAFFLLGVFVAVGAVLGFSSARSMRATG